MTLQEFGDTPIRTLLMLYEDLERLEAHQMLNAIFTQGAARNPGNDHYRHIISDLRETALGDYEFDRRRGKPEYESKEAYFEAMERMGHKAIEV